MSIDQFTHTWIEYGDSRVNEYDELPAEEKQSSAHFEFQLLPGSDKLELEEIDRIVWHHFKLTDEDFNTLESLGLRGKLKPNGGGHLGEEPFTSRTIIVAERPITEPIDLPQPNNCEVVYYQVGNEWRKFPEDAPVLKKRFRLTPGPDNRCLYNLWAEAYFNSDSGGGHGGFNWEYAS